MARMLGPHPNVPVEVRKAKRGGWLLVQRNPLHHWNDQLDWFETQDEAERKARMDGQTMYAENTPILRLIDVAEAVERRQREGDWLHHTISTALRAALTGDVQDGGGV